MAPFESLRGRSRLKAGAAGTGRLAARYCKKYGGLEWAGRALASSASPALFGSNLKIESRWLSSKLRSVCGATMVERMLAESQPAEALLERMVCLVCSAT